MFKPNLTAVFNIVNKLKGSGAISIAKVLIRKLRAKFIPIADFMSRFILRSKCDCAFAVSIIIRRLRGAFDLCIISSRVWCNGILVRLILGIAAIQLFGIPVVGFVYISRLT